MRSIVPSVLLALVACAEAPPEEEPAEQVCATGATRSGILTQIRFVRPADDGTLDGFDLDGVPNQCGVRDTVGPDGTEGIDNAFARLLPALELTEAQAIEEIIQETINIGNLLLMFDLEGLDDPADDCVDVSIFRGAGDPYIGGNDRINAGQTFDVDRSRPPTSLPDVQVDDGLLVAGPFDFAIPVRFLDADFELPIEGASIRIEIHDDGSYSGIMGGAVDPEVVLGALQNTGVNQEVFDTVRPLLSGLLDLRPGEDGVCTHMSAALSFEAVQAFVYDNPPGDTGLGDPSDTGAP